MTTLPAISEAPDPPLVTDPANTFNEKAFAFLAWMATAPDEFNALAAAMEAYAQSLFTATSTTSNLIAGSGTKNFTVQAGKAFGTGQPIVAASASGPANYMVGTVFSYNIANGALVMTVTGSGGSGTKTDWNISLLPSGAALLKTGDTMTGLLVTLASATGTAGLRLPHGAAPTSPTNGDFWTTTLGAFLRLNGATKQFATLDTVETLSNKTLIDYSEVPYAITDGAAFEIDPTNGSIQTIILGAARTPKATNMGTGQSVLLGIDDGSAYAITWTDTTFGPSGVKWVDNTIPSLATSGLTWVTLWKVGSQVYGSSPGATS